MKKRIAIVFAGAVCALASAAAHAGNVFWSVGINAPMAGTVISNVPVYAAPVPVYVAPPPVVYAPSPVVYEPRPVIYRPAPVVYGPPAYYRPVPVVGYGYRDGWEHGHRHEGWDRDHDRRDGDRWRDDRWRDDRGHDDRRRHH